METKRIQAERFRLQEHLTGERSDPECSGRSILNRDQIDGGFILVARRMPESEIMRKPPLHFKLFVWMLLQASYKDYGKLKRGQFFTSIDRMREAMTYCAGYRPVRPSIRQIRGVLEFLTDRQMVVTTKVSGGMMITIRNYNYYQTAANYVGHCGGQDEGSGGGSILTKRKEENRESPSEISTLKQRYPDQNLIDQAFAAIASTRKSGKVADSVLESQLRRWAQYPVTQVEAGIRTYLNRGYAAQGKDENYLWGIIRRHEAESPRPHVQPSGSPLLDFFYGNRN